MDEPIHREITLAAPIGEVWRAVTTAEGLAAWLRCLGVEVDARPDAPVLVRWPDGATSRGLVEEVDAPRRFAFRWRRLSGAGLILQVGEPTRVVFELEPDGDGTRVTVTESPGLLSAGGAVAKGRA